MMKFLGVDTTRKLFACVHVTFTIFFLLRMGQLGYAGQNEYELQHQTLPEQIPVNYEIDKVIAGFFETVLFYKKIEYTMQPVEQKTFACSTI